MKAQLGNFEGSRIDIGAIKLSGSAAERVGKLALGEEVWVVGRAIVGRIEHGETKDGFVRVHKAEVVSMALVGRDEGQRMLTEGQALADERFGLAGLFARDLALTYDAETGEITADDDAEEAEA